MQQARPLDEWGGQGSGTGSLSGPRPGELDLEGVRARLDGGLLMVFGPDGDPVPPQTFIQAAERQGHVLLPLEDGPAVPAGRVAQVLGAQAERRLVESDDPGGHAWLLAMLGVGPAPEGATAEELAAELTEQGLMVFGQELLITGPTNETYLLRPHDGSDPAAAVKIVREDGTATGHEALVEALRGPGSAGDGTVPGAGIDSDGAALRIVTDAGETFRLLPCDGDDASSLLLAPDGESHPLERLVDAFAAAGAAATAGATPGSDNRLDDDEPGQLAAGGGDEVAGGFPAQLVLAEDGLLDLSWLGSAAARALGEPVRSLTLRYLPESVRPTVGHDQGEGAWRLTADELGALTLLATPEGLAPFTVDLLIEGDGSSRQVTIPVRLGGAGSDLDPMIDAGAAVAVDVAFPPPLSPRNELAFFAVVMVDGVPRDAALTAGVRGTDGRWTLAPHDLRSLRLHLPAGAPLPCTLEATGINIENRDGVLATARSRVVIGAGALSSLEEQGVSEAVTLDFHDLLEAAEVGERRVDAVALSGLPPVAELSRGMLDRVSGCWVLRRDELLDVALTVRDPALRSLRIKATAVATDGDGEPVATARPMEVALPPADGGALERTSAPGFFRSLADRRA